MAVGLSGWGQQRGTRDVRGARLEAHAVVQRAEAELVAQQAALREALTSSATDLQVVLTSMAAAEDALLAARQAWTRAGDTGAVAAAPQRERAQVTVSFERQVKRARRAATPRPSFTYGSWV